MAAPPLESLGRYKLSRVLGKGAMGVVYEGRDPKLNRTVAVKTILVGELDPATAQDYSKRFAREAQAVARLNHPNIVQVYDFGEEGEIAYIVMEYIRGKELKASFDANEKFEIKEAVRLMTELLDALEFAHNEGVVHRDIKPANVMVDSEGHVKLADFGVARISDPDRPGATQVGTMVGTPAYMSPEQVQGHKIDRRTDIFSAGVIFYQFLTGQKPFQGGGAFSVAKRIVQDDPPAPSLIIESLSPEYDRVINRALAKDPARRYQSAKEFAEDLQRVLKGLPTKPAEDDSTQLLGTEDMPRTEVAPAWAADAQGTEVELEFWRAIKDTDDPEELDLYIENFPQGVYLELAKRKLAALRGTAVPEDDAAAENAEREAEEKRQAEEKAKRDALEKARRETEARVRREAAEKARRAAEEKARLEAEAKAKRDAEEKAKRDALEKARRETEERVRREAAERARRAAEEKARLEAEAKARREAEEKARREAEEKARREAAEKARREAEERARIEAEARARREAEEKARREAEERARRAAEEKARLEAEARARREAEERARREAEERARREAAEKARREAAEKARREAEERARLEAEAKARREAEERARREAAEKARREAEERARREAEERARLEAEEKARREAEERARAEAEAQARRESIARAMRAAEAKAIRANEVAVRLEASHRARLEAEESVRTESQKKAMREAERKALRAAEIAPRRLAREAALREAQEQAQRESEERVRGVVESLLRQQK
ncbi:MAG: serine/threonine protein kinase [Proteobacteria bacterium]|nr:serine/threonine protein kinase [Pseudomonadota bacterium]